MNTVEVESINNVMLIKINCRPMVYRGTFMNLYFCLSKDKYTDITTVVFLTLQLSLNVYSA